MIKGSRPATPRRGPSSYPPGSWGLLSFLPGSPRLQATGERDGDGEGAGQHEEETRSCYDPLVSRQRLLSLRVPDLMSSLEDGSTVVAEHDHGTVKILLLQLLTFVRSCNVHDSPCDPSLSVVSGHKDDRVPPDAATVEDRSEANGRWGFMTTGPTDAWVERHYEVQYETDDGQWRRWLRGDDVDTLRRCMKVAEGHCRLVLVVAAHEVIELHDG